MQSAMKEALLAQLADHLSNIVDIAADTLYQNLNAGTFTLSSPHPGSLWVTSLDGQYLSYKGLLLSAYYHPSKTHTATTDGKTGPKRSTAHAGEWAISVQSRGMAANKAFYNTLDD